jgi:hypothetical protein
MWQYMDAIRLSANQTCMGALSNATATIDLILAKNNSANTHQLKSLFGLSGVVHDDDFVSVLPVGFFDFSLV